MKKMPCVFVRNFEARPAIVTTQVTPGCEWVLAGEGIATRKWDGTSAMVQGGRIFARYDCKRGKTPPAGAIPCDPAPDEKTGHWPHWVLVDAQPEYRWHAEALQMWMNDRGVPPDGTYEVVGPKIGANPEGFSHHRMIPHGTAWYPSLSDRPITITEIQNLLEQVKIEGLVFHHNEDQRMAKIRRGDFGLAWPVEWIDDGIGRLLIAERSSVRMPVDEYVDYDPQMPNDHPLDMAFLWRSR